MVGEVHQCEEVTILKFSTSTAYEELKFKDSKIEGLDHFLNDLNVPFSLQLGTKTIGTVEGAFKKMSVKVSVTLLELPPRIKRLLAARRNIVLVFIY